MINENYFHQNDDSGGESVKFSYQKIILSYRT